MICKEHQPDLMIEISRDACESYEYDKAYEMIEIGKRVTKKFKNDEINRWLEEDCIFTTAEHLALQYMSCTLDIVSGGQRSEKIKCFVCIYDLIFASKKDFYGNTSVQHFLYHFVIPLVG